MKLLGPTLWPDREDARDIVKIQNIWKAWRQIIDKGQSKGKSFYMGPRNDDPDIGDDDSVRTGNHRVLRKRKLPEQQGSPTPAQKSSKQQRLADDGAWLDDETLREFDQQTSTHVKGMKSKKELVLEWLNGVSTTGVKESSSLDVTMAVAGALLVPPQASCSYCPFVVHVLTNLNSDVFLGPHRMKTRISISRLSKLGPNILLSFQRALY